MMIQWYGQNNFTIRNKQVRVVIASDPGQSHIKTTNQDLVLLPVKQHYYSDQGGVIFHEHGLLIDGAGEYSYKGVSIRCKAIPNSHGQNILIYSFAIEGVVIVSLSSLDRLLVAEELKSLDRCDVLIIPTGGAGVLDKKKAIEIINKIEPRIVIPSYTYLEPTDSMQEPVE